MLVDPVVGANRVADDLPHVLIERAEESAGGELAAELGWERRIGALSGGAELHLFLVAHARTIGGGPRAAGTAQVDFLFASSPSPRGDSSPGRGGSGPSEPGRSRSRDRGVRGSARSRARARVLAQGRQHLLNFFPLPHGQRSFGPTLGPSRRTLSCFGKAGRKLRS